MSCVLLIGFVLVAQTNGNKPNNSHKGTISFCAFAKNPSRHLEEISIKAHLFYRANSNGSDDDCFFALADSIKKLIIDYNHTKAYVALDSLLKYSDGFYSEYFDDVLPQILRARFKSLLTYLCINKMNNLEQFLVWGLYFELGGGDDRDRKRREFDEWINMKVKSEQVSAGQVKYLRKILKKVDEEIKND